MILIQSRLLPLKLVTAGLALVVTIVSQSIVHKSNSASLADGNDTVPLITAINKTEVGLLDGHGPSALNLARFYASNYRVIDDKSKGVLLSTLGVKNMRADQAASQFKSLTDSILLRNRGSDGVIVKDAVWSYAKYSPLVTNTGITPHGLKETRAQINAWLKTNTHGMICDDQMAQNDFDDSYHIKNEAVLATSVYANLKWTKPFQASETQPENFFVKDGWCDLNPPGKVQTMHSHGVFEFFSDGEIKAVKLPCQKSNSTNSFDIVLALPTKGPGSFHHLQPLLTNWDSLKWQKWLRRFHPVTLDLSVPKFHCGGNQEQGAPKCKQWTYELERVTPPKGRCSISYVTAVHDVIFDERGFRFAEGDEYYFTHDQSLRSIPTLGLSHFQDHSNSPPGLTYLYYHHKPGMIIDQPFIVLVFDKKSNALVYMTVPFRAGLN